VSVFLLNFFPVVALQIHTRVRKGMDRGKGVGGGERSRGIAVGLMAADLVRGQR
jgi:hypothetical protein